MKRAFIFVSLALLTSSWGFYAHMRINHLAVFTLPSGMARFYKSNISYLTDHATEPDKRRYADTAEAPRHYLDVESYEPEIDSIPRKWDDALKKYGLKKLNKNGILPWQIQRSYYQLVNAFKQRDSIHILRHSAYLGHYLADAHVPLHTTENHNGQLTHQEGIHAFWESRLPELFADRYNFLVGRATYVNDPLQEAWKIVTHTHALTDSVLELEAELNKNFPAYRKYSYSKRNKQVTKQYSFEYSRDYHVLLNHMVERQMRAAILAIGSYWFSAWVDAGQPTLEKLVKIPADTSERHFRSEIDKKYKEGKIIGREN
ncbi:zinc dependent phospholipase C family protein [Pedobacter sp. L105]|uniref:zinc dependent phospholipase C family protein n=1 Tax=Pedobacter sp. L105 TaxID=1641871 RepID=UPI00131C8E89|nr:zinc dependent phospholipase C family protein [Pedobacter sp. L105]